MLTDNDFLVPVSDANQNFSKVLHMVDRDGISIILKNNHPKYAVIDFSAYEDIISIIQKRKQQRNTIG